MEREREMEREKGGKGMWRTSKREQTRGDDKVPGNCHRCSAIFITGQGQSSLKALQIAYPLRSIHREALDGGGGKSHKFSLFYSQRLAYIRNKRDKTGRKVGGGGGEARGRRDNESEEKAEAKEEEGTSRRENSWHEIHARARARSAGFALRRRSFVQPLIALSAVLLL